MIILLIDNDPIATFLTAQFLQDYPLANTFHPFSCPLAAMHFIHQQLYIGSPPDVIFLDPNTILLNEDEVRMALQSLEPLLRGRCAVYLLSSALGAGPMPGPGSALITGFIPFPLDGPGMQLVERHLMRRRWNRSIPFQPGSELLEPPIEL